MVDAKILLADLQRQVKAVEADLREQVDTIAGIAAPLRAEYDAAKRAGRTAQTRRAWEDERITQAAVAWVLATVFVRFCEDNGLFAGRYLAGASEPELVLAEESEGHYFATDSDPTFRGWLERGFGELADSDAGAALFDRRHNPLYSLPVSHDGAKALVAFWRRRDDSGRLVHQFTDESWDTRFLGDLYQYLSEAARKQYALLQTPRFVEEFILDRTLTHALTEFGHEGLRLIDPTCGSGHFLLGAFDRLLDVWQREAPDRDRYDQVRRTLDSIHGVDLNPFAVAIARFRLLIAALRASDIDRLDQARGKIFSLHVAIGDSLIKRRQGVAETLPGLDGDITDGSSVEDFAYRIEDIRDHPDLLRENSYHVVVGNPPYITVRDPKMNRYYRETYEDVCHKQYALSAPFAKRFFELACNNTDVKGVGYVGQITANSFMKRDFGADLVRWLATSAALTEVIDTSGAFVPGHGTPTVILIGRNAGGPRRTTVRAVSCLQGERGEPIDAAQGVVWRAIVDQIDRPGSESEWITVADVPKGSFSTHPWSMTGGMASALVARLTEGLPGLGIELDVVGRTTVLGEDDAWLRPDVATVGRRGEAGFTRVFVTGNSVRDYAVSQTQFAVTPYTDESNKSPVGIDSEVVQHLWPLRSRLRARRIFGHSVEYKGRPWYVHLENYHRRFLKPLSVTFAFVATHNHFAFDRGGKLFNRHAPVVKLNGRQTEPRYLSILGLLNSSMACFWLKQVCQAKSGSGIGRGIQPESWMERYEFTGSKLEQFPLPAGRPVERTTILDGLAQRLARVTPAAVAEAEAGAGVPSRERLAQARAEWESVRAQMIAVQEELDWEVYQHYGLLGGDLTCTDPPELRLGERAFEIVLARRVAAGETQTRWFVRHGSTPVTEIPAHWPAQYQALVQRRIDVITTDRSIGLIEQPECKRRWSTDGWAAMQQHMLRDWLADRCEARTLWFDTDEHGQAQPRPRTVNQVADALRTDDDVLAVAQLYQPGRDLAKLLADLLDEEHVPFLAALRYKPSGMASRADWEQVWDLQRAEDGATAAGDEAQAAKIRASTPVPPTYKSGDFRKPSFWHHRGKLDVPKERFISYPHCGRGTDPSLLLGWAGWDHAQQAQVISELVSARQSGDGWDAARLTPLLAGLREVIPWVEQWHDEIDPVYGSSPAQDLRRFLTDKAQSLHLTDQHLADWRPPAATRGRRRNG